MKRRLEGSYQFLLTFVLDDTRHTHTLLPLAVSHRLQRLRAPSHHPSREQRHLHNKRQQHRTFALEHALVKLWHARIITRV
jgi:hypothetical protein